MPRKKRTVKEDAEVEKILRLKIVEEVREKLLIKVMGLRQETEIFLDWLASPDFPFGSTECCNVGEFPSTEHSVYQRQMEGTEKSMPPEPTSQDSKSSIVSEARYLNAKDALKSGLDL